MTGAGLRPSSGLHVPSDVRAGLIIRGAEIKHIRGIHENKQKTKKEKKNEK